MPDELNPNDDRKLAESFADPNAQEDTHLGKAFEATNASRKPRKPREERHREPGDRKWLWWGLAIAAVIFVVALLAGGLPRLFRERSLKKEAQEKQRAKPVVQAQRVESAKTGAGVTIPGTTIPLTEAYVYARASGYLKARYVDIGDHVRKGQLLALIEAPDLDAQVDQGREQLRQAEHQLANQKAQLELQRVTLERYRVLVNKGVLSRQQGDNQETAFATQQANVDAADRNVQAFRANLNRLISLQSYEQVRAPFTGVITQRNVDVGALISTSGTSSGAATGPAPTGQFSTSGGSDQGGQSNNGGTSGAANTAATSAQTPGQGGPLFGLADETKLRILVSVPETYVVAVHTGQQAKLLVQEYPGVTFTGDITRTARSIDPNTRTLLTEVQVDNHEGKLMPGMYSLVTFPSPPGVEGPLQVVGDAIYVRQNTTSVATIVNGKVHFVPVTLGRDFGDVVEVLAGLHAGQVVVTTVSDDVTEGREVDVKVKEPGQTPKSNRQGSGKPGSQS